MVTLRFPQGVSHRAVLRTAVGIFCIGVNRENWAATNPGSEVEELPGRFSQGQPRSPQTAVVAVMGSESEVARVFWPEANHFTVVEIY
jgi:hypothetical protein